jgi:UPF0755 protein
MARRAVNKSTEASSSGIFTWLIRIAVFGIVLLLCLVAFLLLYFRWQDTQLAGFAPPESGSTNLDPIERLYLRSYLAMNKQELDSPLNSGEKPFVFIIEPGENAEQIALNLVDAGILSDSELFRRYVRYYGLDSGLEAGTFTIEPHISVSSLAALLSDARLEEIKLRFIEGWRIEEMANYLRQIQPANIDADEFEALVRRQQQFDLSHFDFLASLPDNVSLEGFLFPDTYRIPIDADASYLVRAMLSNFGHLVTPSLRQAYGAQGLTVHEAVTLASIVQREAVVAEERPVMVGVFLNRLSQGILLQADPTVQYAVGYQSDTGRWWKSPLSAVDLEVDSPYNTYRYPGLPPAPISNPGFGALEAAGKPVETEHLFFVVDCTSSIDGAHVFSRTFEEHLANVERCR